MIKPKFDPNDCRECVWNHANYSDEGFAKPGHCQKLEDVPPVKCALRKCRDSVVVKEQVLEGLQAGTWVLVRENRRSKTVSYTHLDVYKRQAIARPECVDVERSITRLFEDACGDFCQRQRSDSCDEGIGTAQVQIVLRALIVEIEHGLFERGPVLVGAGLQLSLIHI